MPMSFYLSVLKKSKFWIGDQPSSCFLYFCYFYHLLCVSMSLQPIAWHQVRKNILWWNQQKYSLSYPWLIWLSEFTCVGDAWFNLPITVERIYVRHCFRTDEMWKKEKNCTSKIGNLKRSQTPYNMIHNLPFFFLGRSSCTFIFILFFILCPCAWWIR